MEDRMAQSAQTGAFTLMILVKNYRSQMIALLLKNGVAVPSGASDKQIINMMASLLKISKSFYKDIYLKMLNTLEQMVLQVKERVTLNTLEQMDL